MRHGCSSGVALIICMQHTQKGMMAVKSSLNLPFGESSLIIFQNHYFFSFFGGALLQSLSSCKAARGRNGSCDTLPSSRYQRGESMCYVLLVCRPSGLHNNNNIVLSFFFWKWCNLFWIQAILSPPCSAISPDAYIYSFSSIPIPVFVLQISVLAPHSCRSQLQFWRALQFCSGQHTNNEGPRHSSN